MGDGHNPPPGGPVERVAGDRPADHAPRTPHGSQAPEGRAERFAGHDGRECGEHRTTGRRAWCLDCSEWCYPGIPCRGCELPKLRAALAAREETTMPETTPRPAETCGASTGAIRLGDAPPHYIGPCVLRKDHDGPVHQAQDGTQWAGDVGRAPEAAPRPDVPDELIVRAAKASSVHFEHCDDGETWQDCPDCRRAYDRAHYAVAAVVPVIERRARERVAAEIEAAAPECTVLTGAQTVHRARGMHAAARIARGEAR